jgi:type II secretory pathway pseudopilin PulG
MIVAGALVVVVAIVLAIVVLGGSSAKKGGKASSLSTVVTVARKASTAHARKSGHSPNSSSTAAVANPAETTVAVLNGTETQGLAHRVAIGLQQGGYSQANALNGRPPGSGQVTVVEYAGGHQAEAEGVARSLSVKQVQPLEAAVAGLAGSAQVVVIVGANTTAP